MPDEQAPTPDHILQLRLRAGDAEDSGRARLLRVENHKEFERELERSGEILRRNRHRSSEPFDWYGPEPEPNEPGPDCKCSGCFVRFPRYVERIDKYNLCVGGIVVTADEDQEARIRSLTPEQQADFRRVMGGK